MPALFTRIAGAPSRSATPVTQRLDGRFVANVEHGTASGDRRGLQVIADRAGSLLARRRADDRGALAPQCARNGSADAARRPRDDSDAAGYSWPGGKRRCVHTGSSGDSIGRDYRACVLARRRSRRAPAATASAARGAVKMGRDDNRPAGACLGERNRARGLLPNELQGYADAEHRAEHGAFLEEPQGAERDVPVQHAG